MKFIWSKGAVAWHWALFGAAGSATLVCGLAAGFEFQARALAMIVNAISLLALAGYLAHRRQLPRVAALLGTAAWVVATATVMSHASYILAAADFPLCDPWLAAIDTAIGIDVPGIARTTGQIAWLSHASAFAYGKTAYLLFFGCFVLIAMADFRRLCNTLSILLIGMTVTLVLSALLPAAGAFVHHKVGDSELGHLAGIKAGVWHLTHFESLRDRSMRVFPTTAWEGLVTFPSFHTIYALTGAYALARTRWLALPASLFAGGVVFSTLPVGGHHFVDVIAGAAIFAATVAIIADRGWADMRKPLGKGASRLGSASAAHGA